MDIGRYFGPFGNDRGLEKGFWQNLAGRKIYLSREEDYATMIGGSNFTVLACSRMSTWFHQRSGNACQYGDTKASL